MTIQLRGLTWDHPRAIAPLRGANLALRAVLPNVSVTWDVQPLAGFETRQITEAAQIYDLVIFDHPHVGAVARRELFLPLDAALSDLRLTDGDFVGPSLATYRYEGRVWGLPLDAACQVCCMRPDLLAGLDVAAPSTWSEVLAVGERAARRGWHLAMAFGGVHALMTFLSLCANQSAPLADEGDVGFADRDAARSALDAMQALVPLCAEEALSWNSIAVQEAMCARDDLVMCPVVYGFVPYTQRAYPRQLTYGNFPGIVAGFAGSTIGGAGLGISAFSRESQAALAVARFLIDADVQESIIAAHCGQPARTATWESAAVNRHSGEFYARTRSSIDRAWVRPRFDGYLHFQRSGGSLVEACMRKKISIEQTIDRLERAWVTAQSHGM